MVAASVDPARGPRPVPRGRGGAAPARAGRTAGGRRRRRRPDPTATGGGHRVLRGARLRRALRDAAHHRGPTLPRRGVPAVRPPGLRRRVGRGDGHAALAAGGGGGAGLGRGVPRHRRPTDPARAGPDRCRSGCGTPPQLSCAVGHRRDEAPSQDGDRVRQARRRRDAHPRRVAPHHGRPPGHRDLGHRRPHRPAARRARHHHRRRAGRTPTTTSWPRHFGPRIGPSLRIQGLGGDDAPVRDEPHVAKSRSREETFRRDLVDRAGHRGRRSCGSRTRSRRPWWPRAGSSPTSRSSCGPRASSPGPAPASSRSPPPIPPRWRGWRSWCSTGSSAAGRCGSSASRSSWRRPTAASVAQLSR